METRQRDEVWLKLSGKGGMMKFPDTCAEPFPKLCMWTYDNLSSFLIGWHRGNTGMGSIR